MARKRMISPDIWESDSFSELSILAKLVFIGMFSNADDEGRGKAKAAFLKSKLFPYDDSMRVADIEAAIDEVAVKMSVTIYSHDGKEYYSLDNWTKWQRVDKPSPSNIIPYDSETCDIIRGTFQEHSANVLGTFPPNRIEDKKNRKGIEDKRSTTVPYEKIKDMFNGICVSYPKIQKLSEERKKAIKARFKEYSIDDFKRLFEKAENSSFLKGKNQRNWSATFDWLIKDANMAKVLDDNYRDKNSQELDVYKDNLNYDELEKIMQEKM